MTSTTLVQKIYQLFVSRGLSQAEVARRIGMQPSHLNRFLKGHGDMGSVRLISLLSELGVDLNQVLDQVLQSKSQASDDQSPSSIEPIVELSALENEALKNWIQKLQYESRRERELELERLSGQEGLRLL